MPEKFDPASADKHADPVKDRRAEKARDELEKGLKDSFPASDPVGSVQPAKTKPSATCSTK